MMGLGSVDRKPLRGNDTHLTAGAEHGNRHRVHASMSWHRRRIVIIVAVLWVMLAIRNALQAT
jgi:hypothetical protein